MVKIKNPGWHITITINTKQPRPSQENTLKFT